MVVMDRTLSRYPTALRLAPQPQCEPIATAEFPSNWELSAARAASVARLLIDTGVDPHRLAISGRGEFQPEASNATAEGRNHNRRVKLIVLGGAEGEDDGADAASERAVAATLPANDSHEGVLPTQSTPGARLPGAP
jgi:chemotaxis protein MotB